MVKWRYVLGSVIGFFIVLCMCSACSKSSAEKEIVLWHWMTDRDEVFQDLSQKYLEKTGVRVNFELYAPSASYVSKIQASAQARTLPDIYGILGESSHFAKYIKAGFVQDLTPYMEADGGKWKDQFFPKALSFNEMKGDNAYGVQPGIYGVPLDVMNIQMIYNKNLFKKAGLDPENPPKTWEELVSLVPHFDAIGVKTFVSGWGENWIIDCFAKNYAYNIMGIDKVVETYRGNVRYTDPDWVKVFSLFEELRDKKVLASGVVTMINKSAEQMFALERAAFTFNGSWCVNVYTGMNPNLDYVPMLPPKINESGAMYIRGGAGSSFHINPKSQYVQESVDFLKWLTAVDQQVYLTKHTRNLPAVKGCEDEILPVLKEFVDNMDSVIHPRNFPLEEKPIVLETFSKGIQAILIGTKTPKEVAQAVDRVKQAELKKS